MKYVNKTTFELLDSLDSEFDSPELTEILDQEFNDILSAKNAGYPLHLNDSGDVVCATSDCDAWNEETQTFDFDLPAYLTENKARLIQDLKSYRWDLFNTQLYVGDQVINVDIEGRQELSFNTQSFSAMPIEDRPATVPFKELDDAGWLDVDPTAAIAWQIMISMADSLESRTAQKAVENGVEGVGGIAQLTTKEEIDAFDVVSEFDAILKPVLAANLAKYAYPIKYHNEDAV